MAAVKIKRSDRFPVGTTVKAYPLAAHHFGNKPSGTALTEGTVDAAGLLELTLTASEPVILHAEVAGENRYLRVRDEAFSELGTLAERIEAKRTEVGA